MDMVRGEALEKAKATLAFDSTKAAKMILKVVRSAEANARNNLNLEAKTLYVSDMYVNPGKFQKTGRPGSRGRFNPILKRTSHIVVGLSSLAEPQKEKKPVEKIKEAVKKKASLPAVKKVLKGKK